MRISIIIIALAIFANCGTMIQSNAPMQGIHGTDLDARIYMSVKRSESVTSEIGSKTGETCQKQILGIAAWGDASIPNAMKKGKLQKIDHYTFDRTIVLNLYPLWFVPVYTSVCLQVYGD
ncbi:MAG: hypothetical protein KDK36_16330 [Leptospiraceae bacterium]|nr:hypothetical protein [Leptospiraceae bacterium]